jgi:[protein-PII] uridylyltransferase
LSVRMIVGDGALVGELRREVLRQWRSDPSQLQDLVRSVARRHRSVGEVAFLLEPDLKEGRGGLRDVHALRWGALAGVELDPGDEEWLESAYRTLLTARVELHRRTGKRGDVLLLEEQDAVAEALGEPDADVLMAHVAAAARAISYLSDETWRRVTRRRDDDVPEDLAVSGLAIRDGAIRVTGDPASDPMLVLHTAVQAARHGLPIDRVSLTRLRDRQPQLPDPWPQGARELFVELLRQGHRAIPVIESLDFFDVWVRLLPEWAPNRSRPQRNVYHRFTVDRHLLETAAEAARLTQRVGRPDLLVVGALLHDIGKGYPGDHTEVGMRLVGPIVRRCGFSEEDVATVQGLVEHHLLLPDVATRRDLEDDQTLAAVADAVGDVAFLELLAALTEADSLATGPTAWGGWKSQLVTTLTEATAHYLSGDSGGRPVRRSLLTEHIEELMSTGEMHVEGEGDSLTVVAPDQAGVFSRAAGALALRGLDVLQADAYSSSAGMAVAVFRVAEPDAPIDWVRLTDDVRRALKGYLAIDARIAERARVYRRRSALAAEAAETSVVFDTRSATDATIVEVRTADHVGVLYQVTRILAEMGLDIRYAKIQTMGHEVIDAFYVTGPDGPILDDLHQREIDLALRHGLSLME